MSSAHALCAIALMITSLQLSAAEPWTIGERELLAPAGASPQMQANIAGK